jgi:hypothetical protein
MTKTSFIPVLVAVALAGAAVPAFAFDGSDNPGTALKPETTPVQPTVEDNPGLTRKECQQFKTNFKENKQAFGKCIAAVAMDLRNEDVSAREACDAKGLSHQRRDGQVRSNFKACVLAAHNAEDEEANESD